MIDSDVLRSAKLKAVRYLDRLGLAQRIVLLIGLGFGLTFLGAYLVSLGNPAANFGWFGYAPLTRNAFVQEGTGLSGWQQMLIWLGLILVWTTAGVVILKQPTRVRSGDPRAPCEERSATRSPFGARA